eukprot:Gregarina_sp_Poly_1__11052@NODE_886_length_5840_cov_23_566603_g633_i0_p8_GENE_NODE_886_length_5840_cov_23_566603_g633_i0NODE_886_length_5840_cov_23_566603_g633_i0_p8_ORF_typecomplete_len101_score5_59DUF773/PF05600_12/0_075_NODE_886_length_5840_cov_23_566603_g633_i017642066
MPEIAAYSARQMTAIQFLQEYKIAYYSCKALIAILTTENASFVATRQCRIHLPLTLERLRIVIRPIVASNPSLVPAFQHSLFHNITDDLVWRVFYEVTRS